MNSAWQLPPPGPADDDGALCAAVEETYRALVAGFGDDLAANPALPVETRALRSLEQWRVLLLLTPWMFSRLLLPAARPALSLPPGWSASERRQADPVVLGPLIDFTLGGTAHKGHLNYHPGLGHYLIQPLVLAMEGFDGPEAVYAAWNEVIRTRDANMQAMKRECPFQQEVSRREFFRGLLPPTRA